MTAVMQSTLRYLQRVRLWPGSGSSSKILTYLVLLSETFLLVGSALDLIFNPKNPQMVESLENVISQTGVFYFMLIFLRNQQSIAATISEFTDFRKFGEPPRFQQQNTELERLARMFKIAIMISISILCIGPLILRYDCDQRACGLLAPVWLPFNYKTRPVKVAVYLWQCYCCMMTYGAAGTISIAMLETMEHLVIRIQHLKMMLEEMVGAPDAKARKIMLKRCVDYHVHSFEVAKQINYNFGIGLTVHVVVAGMIFAIIGHTLITGEATMDSFSLFCGWLSCFVVVCFGGQHLIDESLSVGTALYNTKWYGLDPSFRKNIFIILIRSQRPIQISAGPFSYLSLILILTVLQTAYSYLNLLSATA